MTGHQVHVPHLPKKDFYEKFGMYDTGEVFNKAGQEFIIMEILF